MSNVVKDTCEVIWNVLAKDFFKAPSSADEWKVISWDFFLKWNFPNCIGTCTVDLLYIIMIGAVDGKHIVIQAPQNSGSLFYNYKGTFSVVLMAVCDANHR